MRVEGEHFTWLDGKWSRYALHRKSGYSTNIEQRGNDLHEWYQLANSTNKDWEKRKKEVAGAKKLPGSGSTEFYKTEAFCRFREGDNRGKLATWPKGVRVDFRIRC